MPLSPHGSCARSRVWKCPFCRPPIMYCITTSPPARPSAHFWFVPRRLNPKMPAGCKKESTPRRKLRGVFVSYLSHGKSYKTLNLPYSLSATIIESSQSCEVKQMYRFYLAALDMLPCALLLIPLYWLLNRVYFRNAGNSILYCLFSCYLFCLQVHTD